jgi:hypothetical protein
MCNALANTTHLTLINGRNEGLEKRGTSPDYMNFMLLVAKSCVNV